MDFLKDLPVLCRARRLSFRRQIEAGRRLAKALREAPEAAREVAKALREAPEAAREATKAWREAPSLAAKFDNEAAEVELGVAEAEDELRRLRRRLRFEDRLRAIVRRRRPEGRLRVRVLEQREAAEAETIGQFRCCEPGCEARFFLREEDLSLHCRSFHREAALLYLFQLILYVLAII